MFRLFQSKKKQKEKQVTLALNVSKENGSYDILTKYAIGEITTRDFWNEYCTNLNLQDTIVNDPLLPDYSIGELNNGVFRYDININLLLHRIEVFRVCEAYFCRRKIDLDFKNDEVSLYIFLMSVTPKWVHLDDDKYITSLVKQEPDLKTKKERKEWYKTKILADFKYEKYKPTWLQGAEWPIVDGKPCLFLYQDQYVNLYKNVIPELVNYYFQDNDTKKVHKITQFF